MDQEITNTQHKTSDDPGRSWAHRKARFSFLLCGICCPALCWPGPPTSGLECPKQGMTGNNGRWRCDCGSCSELGATLCYLVHLPQTRGRGQHSLTDLAGSGRQQDLTPDPPRPLLRAHASQSLPAAPLGQALPQGPCTGKSSWPPVYRGGDRGPG